MKKFILSAFVLGSFSVAFAQTISFDKTTEVYGELNKGANGNRIFKVTNKGDKPLIISNVKPACGCTTPEWKTDPILPGSSADIKVGYNTSLVGPFNKQIEVFSNDPENGRAILNITGTIKDVANMAAPMETIVVESKNKAIEATKSAGSDVKKMMKNTTKAMKTKNAVKAGASVNTSVK